jgi:hypothetical protein
MPRHYYIKDQNVIGTPRLPSSNSRSFGNPIPEKKKL